jgi:putative endonuclease
MGEHVAGDFLRRKGYRILARNYACRIGEVDLICRDGDVLVVVEVKPITRPKSILAKSSRRESRKN